MTDDAIFRVENLKVHFPILGGVLRRPLGWVHAVDGVSFAIYRGETLGVVGESGCGKTTVGRALLRLVRPTAGGVWFFPRPEGGGSGPIFNLASKAIQRMGAATETTPIGVPIFAAIYILLGAFSFLLSILFLLLGLGLIGLPVLILGGLSIGAGIGLAAMKSWGRRLASAVAVLVFCFAAAIVVLGIIFVLFFGLPGSPGLGASLLLWSGVAAAGFATVVYLDKPKVDEAFGGLRGLRKNIQIIFQDPSSSLDPRQLVKNAIAEPIRIHKMTALRCTKCERLVPIQRERPGATCEACGGPTESVRLKGADLEARVVELLQRVGLNPEHLFRFPHEFSGGQKQRIVITRALVIKPEFLVLDEPTSALDVSVQAQILNLLKDLQDEYGLTYLFISHHLAVVRHMADRIAVMYLGRFIEVAGKAAFFANPLHPYAKGLLEAVPIPDPERRRELHLMTGEVPSPIEPPLGCRFHPRCPVALPHCGWEGRDLARALEEASHGEGSPMAGAIEEMDPDGFALRIRLKGELEASAHAVEAFLEGEKASGRVLFRAVESVAREEGQLVVRFLKAAEPELKEVEPGHAVACYLY